MFLNFYYALKPFIPRNLQIALRGTLVRMKRKRYARVWPIDERTGAAPPGWEGWPEGKRFALVLTHDVESAQGQDRCPHLAELEMGLGFRSSFNFVAEGYNVDRALHRCLVEKGFEIGIHGLIHNGNLFSSFKRFANEAPRINHYIREWGAVGFRAPSMYHNLEWTHLLDIAYDSSMFDTDPFEPQPEGCGTIFPAWVENRSRASGYVELPYTLPQDYTVFLLLRETDWTTWKTKLDWIAQRGGMALLLTHSDYMTFGREGETHIGYPASLYGEFLHYVRTAYAGQYWHALPREVAGFWREKRVLKR